jgi:hypothetical protein
MRDQQNSENRRGAGGGRLGRIGTVGDRGGLFDRLPRLLGRVAEWQTRWLQVPVSFGTWGFKSPFAHIEVNDEEKVTSPPGRGLLHVYGLRAGDSSVVSNRALRRLLAP